MKKKILAIIILCALQVLFSFPKQTFASCGGLLTNGLNDWTLTSNCTISGGIYSVWGVINVGAYTLTVANNAALVVDWNADRMTFTTGKVLLSGNGTIHDSQMPENGGHNPYTSTSGVTNCPTGTSVWNPITNSSSSTVYYASTNGRLICK